MRSGHVQPEWAVIFAGIRNGQFANSSLSAVDGLGGSIDTFTGSSNDGPVIGGGFTVDAGAQLGGAVTETNTTITPLCP
ncbi:MAG: hypothetical protein ACYDDO_15285 [Acidiferrobacterales bacterium]